MYKIAVIIAVVIISVNTASALPGSGTEADPWRIESVADFNDFAADPNYWDDHTRLETDVNLAGQTYTTAVIAPDTNSLKSAFQGTAFTGVFDGNGCKIIGLTVSDESTDNDYLGLFGYINHGQVTNLGLEGACVRGDRYVGGLAGGNYGGTVSDCYSAGDVNGTDDYVGGLVGLNWGGIISNCCSTGETRGVDYVGGLVGENGGSRSACRDGTITNCYSAADVSGDGYVGGLVGWNYGSVSVCYSTGDVNGVDEVGGLAGDNSGSVSNCYSAGDVNGIENVGGLVGRNRSTVASCFWDTETQTHGVTDSVGDDGGTVANVGGLPTLQMQTMSTFTSAGWDFIGESTNGTSEAWQMPAAGGYPVLSFFHSEIPFPLSGSGTAGDPYLIGAANELGMVNWYPKYRCFKLTGDIDLSEINWPVSVVPVFNGCFDGDGHKLANMQVSGGGWLALFGYLGKDGQVRNLGLEGVSVRGDRYVGGLVGRNYGGSVSNCYSTGDVNGTDDYVGGLVGGNQDGIISKCYCAAEVNGVGSVGGLVGWNHGILSKCYSTGKTSGGSGSRNGVGGLVGRNTGSVVDCNCTGDVSGDDEVGGLVGENSGGSLSNCWSAGDVHGDHDVGGLVGENNGGSVSHCYSISETSGYYSVGGLVGENGYYGSVSDCYSAGDVNGDRMVGGLVGRNDYRSGVSNCYSTGEVSGYDRVGGVVGLNEYGSVSVCWFAGKATGQFTVGGLAGSNTGSVATCYSTGDVSGDHYVGGLVGWNYGSVSVCYSACDVNGTGGYVGGLVGSNISLARVITEGVVSNCLWDIEAQTHGVTESIGDNAGIVIDVVGVDTAQMQTEETFTSAGWDFLGESANGTSETWQIPAGGGYPVLSFFHNEIPFPLSGSGTASDPYLIGDANQLGMVRWYPKDCHFKVTRDIDLAGINWSGPVVPKFSGCFDGDGHKLVNMRISGGGWRLGLFGYLGKNGQVTDLGLEGGSVAGVGDGVGAVVGENEEGSVSKCHSTSDVTGRECVGGLVGWNSGGTLFNCYSTGDVTGDADVGGLVGWNSEWGSVSNCYSTGNVDGTWRGVGGLVGYNGVADVSNCYSTGAVTGYSDVGGLVGDNAYSIVSKSYSTGDVNGHNDVGGLVGGNWSGSVSNCFWDIETQSHAVTKSIGDNHHGSITNVAGLATADMQTRSTFTSGGWDFVEVWDLACEGMNYPRLVWQIPAGDLTCPHGIDSRDYSFFANRWMDTNCRDNNDCDGVDLDFSGAVNAEDLAILCGHWLEGIGRRSN